MLACAPAREYNVNVETLLSFIDPQIGKTIEQQNPTDFFCKEDIMEESTTDLLNIFDKTPADRMDSFIFEHAKDIPQKMIFSSYIRQTDIPLSKVYANCAGYISKSYFYDVVNGTKNAPSRDVVLIICLAAHLSRKETRRVLENYGHRELYLKDTRDIIIATHINNEDFSIATINEDLYAHDCRLLHDTEVSYDS